MRYFFDTEFIENGVTIELVSIGLVGEDGRELYREVDPIEVPWHRANEWVLKYVRPHLSNSSGPSEFRPRDVVRFKPQIANDILGFVGPNPEFWAYYADYDWVALCQLYGRMIDLPKGWPMFCMDVKQLAVSKGELLLPKQEVSTQHHALGDARWVRTAYEWLMARP